jgi:predicted RNA-binding Zn-ribbon protein involved in translation (DUF1610 family)
VAFWELAMHTYLFAFECPTCGSDWTEFRHILEHEDADKQSAVCMDCDEGGEVEAHYYEEQDP